MPKTSKKIQGDKSRPYPYTVGLSEKVKEAFDSYHRIIQVDLDKKLNANDALEYLLKNNDALEKRTFKQQEEIQSLRDNLIEIKSHQGKTIPISPEVRKLFQDYQKKVAKKFGKEMTPSELIEWLIKHK